MHKTTIVLAGVCALVASAGSFAIAADIVGTVIDARRLPGPKLVPPIKAGT